MKALTYWWFRPGEEIFSSCRMSEAYHAVLVRDGYTICVGYADLPDTVVLPARDVRVAMKRSLSPGEVVAVKQGEKEQP